MSEWRPFGGDRCYFRIRRPIDLNSSCLVFGQAALVRRQIRCRFATGHFAATDEHCWAGRNPEKTDSDLP